MNLASRRIQYPFMALLLLALISCVPKTIHLSQLAKLRIGMNPDEPPKVMGIPPREIFQWSLAGNGESIIIQSYLLSHGDYRSTYFLAYKNGALIFWGYPHEFARSPDSLIREIGRGVLSRQVDSRR